MGILRDIFETADGRRKRERKELREAFVSSAASDNTAKAERILSETSYELDAETLNRALIGAAERNNADLVGRLVQAGADPSFSGGSFYTYSTDRNGYKITHIHPGVTPLMVAAKAGAIDAVKKLVELNANVDAIMENGTSALMFAAKHGYSDTVRVLIYAGADIHFRDRDNRRALELAAHNNHYETHAILKAAHDKKPLPVIEAPVRQEAPAAEVHAPKINL